VKRGWGGGGGAGGGGGGGVGGGGGRGGGALEEEEKGVVLLVAARGNPISGVRNGNEAKKGKGALRTGDGGVKMKVFLKSAARRDWGSLGGHISGRGSVSGTLPLGTLERGGSGGGPAALEVQGGNFRKKAKRWGGEENKNAPLRDG